MLLTLWFALPATFAACFPTTTMTQTLPPKKTLAIPGGPTYAYVYSAAKPQKQTFLILHGFPSSLYDFHHQIKDLTAAGYGVLAPDMLGYGDTDKPSAIDAYTFSKMSSEITKILDHEGLTQVIGVGHDWGSALLGKVWNYFPQYFSSLVFMSVPYLPPADFDLDALNEMAKQAFGYETFGYMYFFNETDAADIITPRAESLLSLIYPKDLNLQKEELCPRGNAKEWVEADKIGSLPSYESEEDRCRRIESFEKGGWTGPLNWYKATLRNIDKAAQSQIPQANYAITKPVIFMGGDEDYVTRLEVMNQFAAQAKEQGLLPNVEVKTVRGGTHWMILEQPQQIFAILDEFARSL